MPFNVMNPDKQNNNNVCILCIAVEYEAISFERTTLLIISTDRAVLISHDIAGQIYIVMYICIYGCALLCT